MNYKDFQKICKQNPDCYCPEEQVLKQYLANTPEYIRRYFIGVGKEKIKKKKENNRLKFLKQFEDLYKDKKAMKILKELLKKK